MYDCARQYWVNLVERFEKHFPDIARLVKRMRWGIPAIHIQGHREDCTYLFGTPYMDCVGHFHGETAEHYWPEANQLGPPNMSNESWTSPGHTPRQRPELEEDNVFG